MRTDNAIWTAGKEVNEIQKTANPVESEFVSRDSEKGCDKADPFSSQSLLYYLYIYSNLISFPRWLVRI